MGTYDAVNGITISPELIQQAECKPTLPIVAMNNQLSDPAHNSILEPPTTGKRVSGEMVLDGHSHIGAGGAVGQILGSKSVFT